MTTTQVPSSNYAIAVGSASTVVPFVTTFSPASTNIRGPSGPFQIGQIWINSSTGQSYILTSMAPSNGLQSANWTQDASTMLIGNASSISGTSSSIVSGTAYVANAAGLTTFTLPTTATVGQMFIISGGTANTGGWKVAQNALQTIHQNASVTTTGVAGSITSPATACQVVHIMCITANTDFVVLYSSGVLVFA